MSKKDTGGPAFPVQSIYVEDEATNLRGMTLLDYFAAKAMQGLLASNVEAPIERFVAKSYEMADAMIKARNQ